MRERLPAEASRSAALAAARALLLEQGPQAVTLKAVAARIGKSHANLIHHFGSATGLQAQLAADIAERVRDTIVVAAQEARAGRSDSRALVDAIFDAFGKEGGGTLGAWMILSGNQDALAPVLRAIHELVEELRVGAEPDRVAESALWLILAATGDALIGPDVASALGLSPETARDLARAHLASRFGPPPA